LLYSALRKALRRFEIDLDTGNVTSATSNTLTDSTKNWGTDIWKDMYIEITGGTGAGQIRRISGNTSDTITVTENWSETPDETSTYRIFSGIAELTLLGGIKENTDNLDISLSALRDALRGADDRTLTDLYNKHLYPVTAEAYNVDVSTEDYSVTINKGNYKLVQVDVKVSVTTTIVVEYSYNNSNWWKFDEVSDTKYHNTFNLAAPYVKVTVKAVSGGTADICMGAVL